MYDADGLHVVSRDQHLWLGTYMWSDDKKGMEGTDEKATYYDVSYNRHYRKYVSDFFNDEVSRIAQEGVSNSSTRSWYISRGFCPLSDPYPLITSYVNLK